MRSYMMTDGVIHISWSHPFGIKSPMWHIKYQINPTGLLSSQEARVHGQFPSDLFKSPHAASIRRSNETYSKVTLPLLAAVCVGWTKAVSSSHASTVPCFLLLHTVSDAASDAIPSESVLKWHPGKVLTEEASWKCTVCVTTGMITGFH